MLHTEMSSPFFSLSLSHLEASHCIHLPTTHLDAAEMGASTDRVSVFYYIFLKAFVVLSEVFKNIGSAALYILIYNA